MKFNLIILTVLTPFFAHAGGGGGLRPGMQTMMMNSPEIVYMLGADPNSVTFAHGKFQGQKWQIQQLRLPIYQVIADQNLLKALDQSTQNKDWESLLHD